MDICSGLKEKVIHYEEMVLADIAHPDAERERGERGVNGPGGCGTGQQGGEKHLLPLPEEEEEWEEGWRWRDKGQIDGHILRRVSEERAAQQCNYKFG